MVGEPSDRRDIVLHSRDEGLKRIYETHRSYDMLQYPLIFCRGEDVKPFKHKTRQSSNWPPNQQNNQYSRVLRLQDHDKRRRPQSYVSV